MDQYFRHYRALTAKELGKLLDTAVVVLDANALLDLYRVSPETRDYTLQILDGLRDRLWLPHQIALEFHRNRLRAMTAPSNQARKAKDALAALRTALDQIYRLPHHKTATDRAEANAALGVIESYLSVPEREAISPTNDPRRDRVWRELIRLYRGKVGPPFAADRVKELEKVATDRIAQRVPPGFADKAKTDGQNRFGDYFLWLQTMEHAEQAKLPMLFVTGDMKDDWWERAPGHTFGPLPELREEMSRVAHQDFHMYNLARFLSRMAERAGLSTNEPAVREVEQLQTRPAPDQTPYFPANAPISTIGGPFSAEPTFTFSPNGITMGYVDPNSPSLFRGGGPILTDASGRPLLTQPSRSYTFSLEDIRAGLPTSPWNTTFTPISTLGEPGEVTIIPSQSEEETGKRDKD